MNIFLSLSAVFYQIMKSSINFPIYSKIITSVGMSYFFTVFVNIIGFTICPFSTSYQPTLAVIFRYKNIFVLSNFVHFLVLSAGYDASGGAIDLTCRFLYLDYSIHLIGRNVKGFSKVFLKKQGKYYTNLHTKNCAYCTKK